MKLKIVLLASAMVMALMSGAEAQNRYSSWSNPESTTASGGTSKALMDELRALIDAAEKDRAANPVFLRDLRAALGRYDNPWASEVLRDDFRDGDYTRNPAWTVASGEYWIEKGYGLRATVAVAAAATSGSQKVSKEELAAAVLGGILNRALGGKNQNGGTAASAPAPAPARTAKIYTAKRISNGFSLTAEFTSWKAEGAFAIGPYQGARSSGYQLVYHPGQRQSLELVRYSTRGTSVVASFNQTLNLEDRRPHVLEWTRTAAGDMTIKMDGKTVIEASDRSFRDTFAGVVMENRGGDYVLSRISVFGQ